MFFYQRGQAETARVIWNNLMTQYPDVIGKENPNNEKIHTIFGNQGGYRWVLWTLDQAKNICGMTAADKFWAGTWNFGTYHIWDQRRRRQTYT